MNRKTGAGAAAALMAMSMCLAAPVYAAEDTGLGVDMSTAYPGITVRAGETVSFPLDFLSLDGDGYDVQLSAQSLPENWTGYFKGDSSQITKVHVDGAKKNEESEGSVADFSLSVPAEAEDGVYEVELLADAGSGKTDKLQLEVTVSAEQTGESNFTSEYPEQQGASGTSFSFDTTLVNNRGTNQSYSLSAETPEGWQATFTPSGETNAVASLSVDAGASQGLTVAITPPENVEKGDYEIPVTAVSADDTLKTTLTVSITGTYAMTLSTPDQRLSFDAYENKESAVTLSITNTGNVDLNNLNLTSSAPTDWEVRFSESTIDTLEAGATKEVTAYVKPGKNAVTGDYVTNISISNEQTSASADFRVSVKTSTTWGLAAVAVIVVLAGGLALIFKKYGRR
ncbi:MAG: NEW3 domain-containing protein [Lachnospiraceae bacterium]|uniref:COG1470 family protein n=1 Tax=Parablautia sp. Marseille-Q6255 TaxID=3039593 RepID=UPI0024BC42E4|nr:NEW3 domain-containing protein [Parablautia sp. Marseille-Q6255]